jgi:KipI family sensor histidine kinase inhibitor
MTLAGRKGSPIRKGKRWRVPVVYGGAFGIDLEDVAARHKMTPQEVISRHSAGDYRVYMLGFLPGYTYLGGLDPALATPRRQDPRLETPSGTVAIGGVQTGIQCITAPSGWNLLGRTPVRTYHSHREPIFLIEPGDHVTFFPVDAGRWEALDRAAEAGEPVAEMVELVEP